MCVAFGTTGTTGTYQGPLTLTLDQISEQLLALDAQLLAQGLEEGSAEYKAAQEQARAEFVRYVTETEALNFSEEDFAAAVGLTATEALAQYYNYDFTDKELFNLPYGDTITTTVTSYNNSPQGRAAAARVGSVFDTDTQAALSGGSWVPQMVTRGDTKDAAGNVILGGVQSPTDYELMTSSQLAPFLPTAPYDVTKISQNTPTYTAAGSLPAGLFDPVNFPQRAITRGTPVITKGFDAAGNPTTGITMGQSTAAPTGANIGQLNTTAQIPTTGMHVAGTGLGGTTVGTMDTTGNIVSTGADNLTQLVDVNNALNTSSVSPTVINTGEEDGVVVTPTIVTMDEVPGSAAYCALYPDTAVCTPGSAEFCALAGNLNHASCKAADKCLDGEELWNGICVPICDVGFTRDSDGICQSNNQGNCPVGTDKPGVRIPDGETEAWCNFPKCPTGTEREGVTIPVGAAANWCDIPEPDPTCPLGTDREGQTIPDGETEAWCTTSTITTCPVGSDKEGDTIPDGQSVDWCTTTITTCPVGTDKEGDTIPDGQSVDWCTTTITTCPVGTDKEGATIPDGQSVDWCTTTITTCPVGTDKEGATIPDGQSVDWCTITTCPAGTVRETETIPDGQTVAWCEVAPVATCDIGTDKAGLAIPANQDSSWCNCGVGFTWNSETKECDIADPVDPWAVEKAECKAAGGTWNDSTKECDAAVDPYAAEKAACDNTGGTWDDTTDPESCIPATATCPAASTNNAGVIIPDGQTLDSFCCPTGEAWNASTNQCEPSGTAVTNVCATGTLRAGAPVPAGKPATWCDLACPTGETWDTETLACVTATVTTITTCPAGTVRETETIPDGQTEAWCAIAPTLNTCPVGTVKEGETIPDGVLGGEWCNEVVDPFAADKRDCDNAGRTWNSATNSCDPAATVVPGIDPYAAEKAVCDNTVGGATWDDVNNICVAAAIGDRFAKEKASCAAISSHYWDETYMACLPKGWKKEGPLDPQGNPTGNRYQTGNELLDQTYAYQTALSTNPVGTYNDPYSIGSDASMVVAAKSGDGPAIPTNLGTSLVPGIHSINFGDGQLVNTGGISQSYQPGESGGGGGALGFGAKGGEVKEGGFRHGGEVEDRLEQRQKASDSRLMRHGGLGQFADEIGDDMLSTIARIMDRRD